MRWSIIKKLFLLNLLYINPQATSLKRKKFANKFVDLQKKLFNSFLLSQLFFIIILIAILGFSDFKDAANTYKINFLFIIVYGVFSLLSVFFTSFYEDKDTIKLMALPVSEKEVFVTKFLTLFFQISGTSFAFIIINSIATIKLTESNIILSLLLVFIYSVTSLLAANMLAIIIFSLLSKTKLFKTYKKTTQVVIQIITIIIVAAMFVWIPGNINKNAIPFDQYEGDLLFNFLRNPLASKSLLTLLGLFIVTIGLLSILYKVVIKNYFNDLYELANNEKANKKTTPKKHTTNFNFNTMFRKMTIKSFSNSAIIIQNLIAPVLMLAFFGGFLFGIRGHSFLQQTYVLLPLAIITGFVFSVAMISQASFPALALSIDYKNFEYLKTLPINIRKYVLSKFFIALVLVLIINSFYWVVLMLLASPSLFFAISSYLAFLAATTIYSVYLFYKDVKKPFTNWSSINQLIMRETSNLKAWGIFLGYIIVTIAIIATTVLLINFFPNLSWFFSLIYITIFVIIAIFVINLLRKQLEKLD